MPFFGMKNFTGLAFVGRIGNFTVDFAAELFEEVSYIITDVGAVNLINVTEEIGDDVTTPFELSTANKVVATVTSLLASESVRNSLIRTITAATLNLL